MDYIASYKADICSAGQMLRHGCRTCIKYDIMRDHALDRTWSIYRLIMKNIYNDNIKSIRGLHIASGGR